MPDKSVFLDSNIIIYAYSDDGRKKDVSIALLKMHPIISLFENVRQFLRAVYIETSIDVESDFSARLNNQQDLNIRVAAWFFP